MLWSECGEVGCVGKWTSLCEENNVNVIGKKWREM